MIECVWSCLSVKRFACAHLPDVIPKSAAPVRPVGNRWPVLYRTHRPVRDRRPNTTVYLIRGRIIQRSAMEDVIGSCWPRTVCRSRYRDSIKQSGRYIFTKRRTILILICKSTLPGSGRRAGALAGGPRLPFPGPHWPALTGGGQCWDIISPPSPGSSPRSPPHWTCLKHLTRKAPSGHPYQMKHLNWLLSKQRSSSSTPSSFQKERMQLKRYVIGRWPVQWRPEALCLPRWRHWLPLENGKLRERSQTFCSLHWSSDARLVLIHSLEETLNS